MRGIDHIQRSIPSHRLKKTEDKSQRREAGTGKKRKAGHKMPTEHKPDSDHIVDELA